MFVGKTKLFIDCVFHLVAGPRAGVGIFHGIVFLQYSTVICTSQELVSLYE
jgi:hypothetical protein